MNHLRRVKSSIQSLKHRHVERNLRTGFGFGFGFADRVEKEQTEK